MIEPIIFEMETSDPDDFMTLLWLADNPKVNLLGVMVTPGSRDQCQLVRWGLDHCGRMDVPVGSMRGPSWWDTEDGKKERVSKFHYTNYGHGVLNHDVGDVVGGPDMLGLSCILNSEITVVVKAGSPGTTWSPIHWRSSRVGSPAPASTQEGPRRRPSSFSRRPGSHVACSSRRTFATASSGRRPCRRS